MNVLITGSNRGIGFEFLKQYLAKGAQVIACCRQPQQAQALQELHTLNKDNLTIIKLNVSCEQDVQKLKDTLNKQQIKLDLLINNAGVLGGEQQHFNDINTQQWLTTLAVNSIAPIQITLACLEALQRSQHPKVINISSMMGSLNRQSMGFYGYRSSKSALNKASQLLALDLKDQQIIVCPIHPGWVKTDMGGNEAEITVNESVTGMINVIEQLTLERSGQFLTYEGEQHPW